MARSHGMMDLQVALFAVVLATGCVGWWNGRCYIVLVSRLLEIWLDSGGSIGA
jgi:hypothetical protein